MSAQLDEKVLIREFNEDRDIEAVEKFEKNCETGSRKGVSIFTNMMGDPMCRIRLYPTHIMLIAELLENRELVGAVRGCIKHVGTDNGGTHVKIGCILGLRVSPKHRRKGIGLKLVKSIEGWAIRNGAQYICIATEESNFISTNLFVHKCNFVKLSSLVILVQPIKYHAQDPSLNVRIEKLSVEQAISLYKGRLGSKAFFPNDMEAILNEKLSLGSWVSFLKEDDWVGLHNKEDNDFPSRAPSSWAILSIWKTCEAYKLQIRRQHPFKCFHATLSHAGAKIFPCMKTTTCDLLHRPFGFLFLYGVHGEGQRLGELIKSLWWFAYSLAGNVKDCKVIVTELAVCDPVREHVPQGPSMSCINDLWYFKKVNGPSDDNDRWKMTQLFVDPRDF
ncbi:hypothetical protein AQUCO_00300520v1 [Aquilegia coerulea]|uniref:N-acetyltransferase domain-containing protein n=1 Tax=Aquilegia coerulea TaxID=218851 RepID=A0A2G5EZ74_AQUCA|nr:hypothetical protein AQUCO_00300520v1 [Aquilegia coerulea]